MRRTLTILLIGLAISGCARDGKLLALNVPNSCSIGGGNMGVGYTITPIAYGESHISVFALSDIARGAEWRLRLLPQRAGPTGVDYTNVDVTIRAADLAAFPWLDHTVKQVTTPVLTICVPMSVAVGAHIKYDVIVDTVGTLDPRADVIQ